MFVLKGSQRLQLLFQVHKQPLARFDRVVGRGDWLVEEFVRLVQRGLDESCDLHCLSQAMEERVSRAAAWTRGYESGMSVALLVGSRS